MTFPDSDIMQRRSNDRARLLVHVAAGISGFFVMGIELLGGRVFAPFFGTSIFVWGAIITVFMTSLAIGYLKGGNRSLGNPSLGTLGWLLVAEGAASLPLVLASDVGLEWLSYLIRDPRYGSLIGAMLFFSIPAILSGMVSPYAIRLLTHSVQTSGQSAGQLYFVSTLGSAAGTILTSFYLVLVFDLDTILYLLIALVVLTGMTLVMADMRQGRPTCKSVLQRS